MIEFKVLQAPDRVQIGTFMHWFAELSIGNAEADFILDDPEIAPQHILISCQGEAAQVQNLSNQPIRINALAVSPGQASPIKNGDKITLGKSQIQVLRMSETEPPPPPPFEHPRAKDAFAEGTVDGNVLKALERLGEE